VKILDRYITKTVIGGTLMVLLVLGSLFVFIDFVSELNDVGTGLYHVFEAGIFVLLSLPRRLYEIFPTAVLIGSFIEPGCTCGQ